MEYAQQAKNPEPERTLNDRLNKVGDGIYYQLDRLESLLGRVNGTPSKGEGPQSVAPTPIRPQHSLAQMVDGMEGALERLTNLRIGLERIA